MRMHVMVAATFCLAAHGAGAESVRVGGDFSFRRVAVPQAGAPRITVQIDPGAEVYRLTPGSTPRRPGDPRPAAAFERPFDPEAPAGDLAWWWDAVSPARGIDAPLRFASAMSALRAAGDRIVAPRLQTLQDIAEAHGPDILRATIGTRVSPALVLAVIAVESAGRGDAVSHAGAQGLMQLMPDTADRFGVADAFDPAGNIAGGVKYLDWLLDRFDRDAVLALAGYNAGEGAVDRHSGVPPFSETRAYVPKVLAAWDLARMLCQTPPELPTDACALGIRRVASGN